MQKSIRDLGVVVASCFNYAGACLLIILWRIDIFYYLPIAFVISCMIGLLIVDVERSVIYTLICTVMGNAIAAAILLSPYMIFAEDVGSTNVASYLVLSSIAKLFLISVTVYFLGAALGCFLGEKISEQNEI